MALHKRIEVTSFSGSAGEVGMVRFLDPKIMDSAVIQELGDELFGLVEKDKRKNLLLNFSGVEFLSSAALNKLIVLDKRIKTAGGKLQLCSLKPEIFEVFAVTRLNQLFAIKRTEQEALAAFYESPASIAEDTATAYSSPGWMALNASAAQTAAAKLATRKIQMLDSGDSFMIVMPTATAGLNAPPEMPPTE